MKRKVITLFRAFVYALLSVSIISCGDHEIKKVEMNNQFAISLFADTITIGDLMERVDSSFYQFIKVLDNGDIYAYYADSVNNAVKADDVFWLVIAVNYCYKALLGIIIGGIGYILVKKRCAEWWLVLVLMLGTLVAHVIFGIMHPYMCNMDFRYVAILNLPMALILGVVMQNISNVWRYIIASIVGVLAVSSTIIWWWVVL